MARKRNNQGIPELTNFDKALEEVYDSLVGRQRQLSRAEQAIVEVYETIGFIEGDGLHSFWYNELDQASVIESFRMIGAAVVADALQESSWAKAVCERGADQHGQLPFTEDEERKLDEIEERIYEGFQFSAAKALQFIRQNGITA